MLIIPGLLVLMAGTCALALVPQVRLCEYDGCPSVSRIGLGALHLGNSISGITTNTSVNLWIKKGLSLGITLYDLADVYPVIGTAGDSTKLFGEALAMTPTLRPQIQIVAKVGIVFPDSVDTTRDYLNQQLDWFLSTLGTSYIDIFLIHFSNSNMNATEVALTFRDMKSSGKVLHFGVSNHYPSKFDLLQTKLDQVTGENIKLVTTEFEASVWNPSYLNFNSSLSDHTYQKGLRALCWGSLGGEPVGGLNRLFVRKGDRQDRILNALSEVAQVMGIPNNDTVALVWLLQHASGVIPLIGTTNLVRMEQQVTAIDYIGHMTNDQWWSIGTAGDLCSYGDSECNYDLYTASFPTPDPTPIDPGTQSNEDGNDCSVSESAKSTLGVTLIAIICVQNVGIIALLYMVLKKKDVSSDTKELKKPLRESEMSGVA